MTKLNQQQKEAEKKINKLYDGICEMAFNARQYVYDGKANQDTMRKIFAINELQGEITFLLNHFHKLVETINFDVLVKKTENCYKYAKTLMEKIEKELEEQA